MLEGGLETDPSVDLIVALDRRNAPGLWIPNTKQARWDPSHPQRHTELFVNTEDELRVHRARVIRLAKVAVKNDGDAKVMCSFNIEALALFHHLGRRYRPGPGRVPARRLWRDRPLADR